MGDELLPAATRPTSTRRASSWRTSTRSGRWQTKERTSGVAIDTVVDMAIDGTTVRLTNVSEMMAKIAASPDGAAALRGALDVATPTSARATASTPARWWISPRRSPRADTPFAPSSPTSRKLPSSEPEPLEPPNEPSRLSEGYWWRRRRGPVPPVDLREEGQGGDDAGQAPGHLLHPQRLPDRQVVAEDHGEQRQRRADRRFGQGPDAGGPDAVPEQVPGAARLPVDERLRVGPADRSPRSGLRLEAHLRHDRCEQQAVPDRRVAGPRDREADQPDAAKPLVLSVGAASTQIKEVISFSDPGVALPVDREPDDHLQPAHRSVRRQRHDAPQGDWLVASGQQRHRPGQGGPQAVPVASR